MENNKNEVITASKTIQTSPRITIIIKIEIPDQKQHPNKWISIKSKLTKTSQNNLKSY